MKHYITEKKATAVIDDMYEGDLYAYFSDPQDMEAVEEAEKSLYRDFSGEVKGYADAIRLVAKLRGYSLAAIADDLTRYLVK
jgi:hypothetical protein